MAWQYNKDLIEEEKELNKKIHSYYKDKYSKYDD